MKKIVLTMAVALLTVVTASAQRENSSKDGKEKDQASFVERRTSHMVKEYGLDSKQEKKLLALNKEYADKMSFRGPRHHQGRPGMHREKPQGDAGVQQKKPKHMPMSPEKREQMKKSHEEYEAKLQKIMTKEQYAKYQANKDKRREHRFNRHQGPAADKTSCVSCCCKCEASSPKEKASCQSVASQCENK